MNAPTPQTHSQTEPQETVRQARARVDQAVLDYLASISPSPGAWSEPTSMAAVADRLGLMREETTRAFGRLLYDERIDAMPNPAGGHRFRTVKGAA